MALTSLIHPGPEQTTAECDLLIPLTRLEKSEKNDRTILMGGF